MTCRFVEMSVFERPTRIRAYKLQLVVTANIMAGNSNLKRTITPGERMLSENVLI